MKWSSNWEDLPSFVFQGFGFKTCKAVKMKSTHLPNIKYVLFKLIFHFLTSF